MGVTGSAGPPGPTGSPGAAGSPGPAGSPGATGPAVPSGGSVAIPNFVTFVGACDAGTTYSANSLVFDSVTSLYYFSIASGNLGNTPGSGSAFWAIGNLSQLTFKKILTLSAPGFVSLMSVHLIGTDTAGGLRATDGGSQIATEEGVMQYLATANWVTCTVQTTDKLHLGTVNSGCTPGFFNPGSQPGVSIFDNVSFSSPAPIVIHEVYFHIESNAAADIRLEP